MPEDHITSVKLLSSVVTDGRDGNALMAIFALEDGQIVWTDISSDGLVDYCEFKQANCANFQANFPQTITSFATSIPRRRENRPFVHPTPPECEFRSDVSRLVRLDGQIVFKKSSPQTDKFVPFFTSDDLSV